MIAAEAKAAPIAWLDQHPEDAEAGPKLARLGELQRLGMPVPAGFVVTASVFTALQAEPVLAAALAGLRIDLDDDALAQACGAVRSVVLEMELPPNLIRAVHDAYEELGRRCGRRDVPVAVRSSAQAEDGQGASFAGQFETYLGMRGDDAVLAAVRRCWASLLQPRAMEYRLQRGASAELGTMAVGVMELVDARSSGVAFSLDPVTGKRDRVVIEGSFGWGEAVVSGQVVPDRFEVGKADGRILKRTVADKLVISAFDGAGAVVEQAMPEERRLAPSLDDVEAMAIADAVIELERRSGGPVDVEWVIAAGTDGAGSLRLVQMRPVTAAPPPPVPRFDLSGFTRKPKLTS